MMKPPGRSHGESRRPLSSPLASRERFDFEAVDNPHPRAVWLWTMNFDLRL